MSDPARRCKICRRIQARAYYAAQKRITTPTTYSDGTTDATSKALDIIADALATPVARKRP